MQRRNREINIFSLSMMDVISGAMGAFLIILIVLARYYEGSPENSESVAKLQRELKKAQEKIEQVEKMFREAGSDVDVERVLRELSEAKRAIEDANRRMADLRDRLDQATAMKNRYQKENEKLSKRNNRLEWRTPYLIDVWFECTGIDVNLYLYTQVKGEGGNAQPYFDPNIKQTDFWSGDEYVDDPSGPGSDIWMIRDVPGGNSYKLYYYLPGADANTKDCKVGGGIFGAKIADHKLPDLVLNGKKTWELVGFINYPEEGDYNVAFTEATSEQRAKEREIVAEYVKRKKEEAAMKPPEKRETKDRKTDGPKADRGKQGSSMVPQPKPVKRNWWNPWG